MSFQILIIVFIRMTEIWNEETGEGRLIEDCENCPRQTGGPNWAGYFHPVIFRVEPDFCLSD